MSRIKSLYIANFRGIRHVEIDIDGNNLLLLGENGTGKSSIIDAVEYFFTGKLEKYSSRGDVKDKDCLPNAFGGDLSIQMTFAESPESISVTFPFKRSDTPAALANFFEDAGSRPFILHRAQLLRFIESRPADRYKVVADLIGLDQIEEVEKVWKELRDYTEARKNTAYGVYQSAASTLSLGLPDLNLSCIHLPDSYTHTNQDIINAIQRQIKGYGLPQITRPSDISHAREKLIRAGFKEENMHRARDLRALQDKCVQIQQELSEFLNLINGLNEIQKLLLEKMACLDEAVFEALLQEGRKLLGEKALEECPLCEQKINSRELLLERIDARLQQLEAFTLCKKQFLEKKKAIIALANTVQRDSLSLHQALQGLNETTCLELSQDFLANLETWKKQYELANEYHCLHQSTENITSGDPFGKINQFLSEEVMSLTPTQSDNNLLETFVFLDRMEQNWAAWQNACQHLQAISWEFSQLDLAYIELCEARKDWVEKILQELQTDFIYLFEKIHPDEGFQAISLIISKEKRNSIGMEASVQGHKIMHPYGNYSEGHLDSLGLCLFLAFIRRFNPSLKLIVLDDVLTSIDAGHRLRVARLLIEEFGDYQIILTTHDEMWANELKIVMESAKGRKSRTKLLRLKPYDPNRGTDIDEYTASDWQYYYRLIDEGHLQDAISGAGRALEKFFSKMRKNFGLAIPATRDDLYTIGNLYGPFFNWIDKHPFTRPDYPNAKDELGYLREDLGTIWRLRNWSGAHYNEWGMTVHTKEAKHLVEIVEELISFFECPVCHDLVVYNSEANVIHCPKCQPASAPLMIPVYRFDWRNTAQRKLQANVEKENEIAVNITKSAFERFLRDMRWIGLIAVAPVPGDKYGVNDLFLPFSNWAQKHPIHPALGQYLDHLHLFLDGDCNWQNISVLTPKAQDLFDGVSSLIGLFECQSCHKLKYYKEEFYCPYCAQEESLIYPQPASWPVNKRD